MRLEPRWLVLIIGTAVAYFVAGWLALGLALPPGYAAPPYPAAGLALAATVVYGRRVLPGVALGAFFVNWLLPYGHEAHLGTTTGIAVCVGFGAALQAGFGAALVKRFVRHPMTLAEPRDVALFFLLGGPVACLVNASLATVALDLWHVIGRSGIADNWWIWWTGDTFGVLIGAPVVLTLIGQPRDEWRANRPKVAIALLALTTLLCLACAEVARRDHQRAGTIFHSDAVRATAAFSTQLERPLYALEAIRGTVAALHDTDDVSLQPSADFWLSGARRTRALGWAQRVDRAQLPAFEAEVRAHRHARDFHVFEANTLRTPEAAADREVVAVREMYGGSPGVLGVNLLSFAPARAAVLAALATPQPVASAGFHLMRHEGGQAIVVVYQGVRSANRSGVVFVTMQLPSTLADVSAQTPAYLRWCCGTSRPATRGWASWPAGRSATIRPTAASPIAARCRSPAATGASRRSPTKARCPTRGAGTPA